MLYVHSQTPFAETEALVKSLLRYYRYPETSVLLSSRPSCSTLAPMPLRPPTSSSTRVSSGPASFASSSTPPM
nr:unnamed protein product [Spirometra erinaceieuropaei]